MPTLTIIVAATSSNLGIGLKGALPWRLKQELAYFRRATTFNPENLTNVVIMGRKCWESIPSKFRPLPNRHNIVLSRKGYVDGVNEPGSESGVANAEVVTSMAAALDHARVHAQNLGRVFVIGGREVYQEAVGSCERILFTEVTGEAETDVEFPFDFRKGGWKRVSHEELEKFVGGEVRKGEIVEGNLKYEFQMWEKDA